MSTTTEQLALQLLALPQSARADLAYRLIQSLEETDAADVERIWLEEARRRMAEIREGRVQPLAAEEVFDDLDRELA